VDCITHGWAIQSPSLEATPFVLLQDEGGRLQRRVTVHDSPDESATFALLSCLIYLGLFIGHPTGVNCLAKKLIL